MAGNEFFYRPFPLLNLFISPERSFFECVIVLCHNLPHLPGFSVDFFHIRLRALWLRLEIEFSLEFKERVDAFLKCDVGVALQ